DRLRGHPDRCAGRPAHQVVGVGVERRQVDHDERWLQARRGPVETLCVDAGPHDASMTESDPAYAGIVNAATWRNWAGTATATPRRVLDAGSADEIAEAISAARDAGLRVKAV